MSRIIHFPPVLVGEPIKWIFEGFTLDQVSKISWNQESKTNDPRKRRWEPVERWQRPDSNSISLIPTKEDKGRRFLLNLEFENGTMIRKASWPVMSDEEFRSMNLPKFTPEFEARLDSHVSRLDFLLTRVIEQRRALEDIQTLENKKKEIQIAEDKLRSDNREYRRSLSVLQADQKKLIQDEKQLIEDKEKLNADRRKFTEDSLWMEKSELAEQKLRLAEEIHSTLYQAQSLGFSFEDLARTEVMNWLRDAVHKKDAERRKLLMSMRPKGIGSCSQCGRNSSQSPSSWSQVCPDCSK